MTSVVKAIMKILLFSTGETYVANVFLHSVKISSSHKKSSSNFSKMLARSVLDSVNVIRLCGFRSESILPVWCKSEQENQSIDQFEWQCTTQLNQNLLVRLKGVIKSNLGRDWISL